MNFFKKWNLRRKMHHRAEVINNLAYRRQAKALFEWSIGDVDEFYRTQKELRHLVQRYYRIQRWLGHRNGKE